MSAPSAVSSKIASISLSSGSNYNLSGVTTKETEQVYEELDYNNVNLTFEFDQYKAATEELAKDKKFISKMSDEIKEELEKMQFEYASRVAGNIEIVSPVLIKLADVNRNFQEGRTIEEFKQSIHDYIIEFALTEKEFLAEYEYGPDAELIINTALKEIILDYAAGKEVYPTDEEYNLVKTFEDGSIEFGIQYTKRLLGKAGTILVSDLTDDLMAPSLAYLRNTFPNFMSNYGNNMLKWTSSIIPAKFIDILFGGNVNALDVAKSYFSSIADSIYGSGLINAISSAMGGHFTTSTVASIFTDPTKIANYTNQVNNLLSGNGKINSFLRKFVVSKEITTPQQFYDDLLARTTFKTTASQAVKSGVVSFVVSEAFKIGEGVLDAYNGGERNILKLGQAGFIAGIDGLPKSVGAAVGATVGEVAGSLIAGALFAWAGPVGAYVAVKAGGLIGSVAGSIFGGWVGEQIGEQIENNVVPAIDKAINWFKAWSW